MTAERCLSIKKAFGDLKGEKVLVDWFQKVK